MADASAGERAEGGPESSPALEPLPFHRDVLAYLKANEEEQWAWFSSAAYLQEYASATRLDLLKSCYRFEPAEHADLYAIAEPVRARLRVDAPVTLYQAQSAAGLNAALWYVPGEAHVVLEGPIRTMLSDDELRTILAHELMHHLLWSRSSGELLVAEQMLSAMAGHSRSEASHVETARLFRLYLEVHCDRAALLVCPDPLVGISALLKVQTGLADLRPESYLRQSEEIFGQAEVKTEGLTHPESFVRARALKLWADQGPAAEAEIARMIEGPLDLGRLSLPAQQRLSRLTRRVLEAFLQPTWLQTDPLVGHARLFFPDLVPPSAETRAPEVTPEELAGATERTRQYLAFVLLDMATIDRALEEAPLAAALRVAEALGLGEEFLAAATRELDLSRRTLTRLRKESARIVADAAAERPPGSR
jgi:hypothetical protein